jgi:hypothetical protein
MLRNVKLNSAKKMFIAGGSAAIAVLCAASLFFYFQESKNSAGASDLNGVSVKVKAAASYKIGGKYSVSWSSDCRGGEAMVWLDGASSKNPEVGMLVPLLKFSAADFGALGQDGRKIFSDLWAFNLSHNKNKEKLSWTMPASINLPRSYFGGKEGAYYIYTLEDGSFVGQKMFKEPITMSVLPGKYLIRVDIKGKNGCRATGYSQEIKVVNK